MCIRGSTKNVFTILGSEQEEQIEIACDGGHWIITETHWKFRLNGNYAIGWRMIDERWYCFDENGIATNVENDLWFRLSKVWMGYLYDTLVSSKKVSEENGTSILLFQ